MFSIELKYPHQICSQHVSLPSPSNTLKVKKARVYWKHNLYHLSGFESVVKPCKDKVSRYSSNQTHVAGTRPGKIVQFVLLLLLPMVEKIAKGNARVVAMDGDAGIRESIVGFCSVSCLSVMRRC